MASGLVESIYLHEGRRPGEPMRAVDLARAVVAGGLEGDRFFQRAGAVARKHGSDREVTLIEAETIESVTREGQVALSAEASRRNIVTRGVELNHLINRQFRVGSVLLRGIRLCEPCQHLEHLTEPGMVRALLHRGGLRAQVVEGGEVRVGDSIETCGLVGSTATFSPQAP